MPLLYEDLRKEILKACFEVSHELGSGYLEGVYQNALVIALSEIGLKAETQVPLSVKFRDKVVGNYVADIVVNDKVILELKSVSALSNGHQAQLINYLIASGIEVGLLINFGKPKMEYRRLHNGIKNPHIEDNFITIG